MNVIKNKKFLFVLAVIFSSICLISSILHYKNIFFGNQFTWTSWLISIIFLVIAFLPLSKEKTKLKKTNKTTYIFIILTGLFFVSHLWNFKTSPWNQNGLFDDAAWNVYFSFKYIFTEVPFQAAFYDHGISREVIFHYYITFAFKLFGYNLLTFNISVLFLGFISYIFTLLLIQKLFKKIYITIIMGIVMNFLQIHFIFSFVGQRYSIVPPLLISSTYFLYIGFKDRSYFGIVLSGVLGGLCFSSGIMGKQYLLGLAAAVVIFLVFYFKKTIEKRNLKNIGLFILGIIISSMPLIIYIVFNKNDYFRNEKSYTEAFITKINNQGLDGLMEFYNRMKLCLFGITYHKWFIPEVPILPVVYYYFLVR